MTHVSRVSLLLAAFFALDKALAIVRQVIIARGFGLSNELDAYNAANNLPDMLFALISGGALAMALIPVLSDFLTRDGRQAAWRIFSQIANLAFLVTAGLAIPMVFLARPLVGWEYGVAPGFGPQQQELVAELMRLNLIATLLFSISGLVMAGLQANQHFFLPALAPILYNAGQIFGALILAPQGPTPIGPFQLPGFGLGIRGLVYGVIIGAAFHLLIQIPGLVRQGFQWTPQVRFSDPGVRQVLRLMGPRLITMLFIQFTFIARDNLASRMAEGAVTALTFGWMVMQVPETLIGTAMGTALLPTLAEQAARKEMKGFCSAVERAVQVLISLTIPVAFVLAAGIGPLIALAFDFGAEGNQLVTIITQSYLLGIAGHSLVEVLVRAFYAQQNARTPMITAGLNALAFGLLAIALMGPMGPVGIAVANTLAFTGQAVLLLVLLNRQIEQPVKAGTGLLRALSAGVMGGGVALLLAAHLPFPLLVADLFGLALGSLVCFPWVWKEARLLIRL